MEITVERDNKDIYTVTVGGKPITTTTDFSELQLKQWIKGVQIVYGKRNRQDVVVGLCADRSINYVNPPYRRFQRGSRKDDPYELLQLCVGQHCLIIELEPGWSPKVLRDFFYDSRTTVVGVGIEKTAAKLEKENGFLIRQRVELRDLAEADMGLHTGDFYKHGVHSLASEVLGEEGSFDKPKKIKWREAHKWRLLSDELVKYATAEAFLVYDMGSKLLQK